ncbi:MAG: hypothetical protein IKZ58_07710 [Selenomonadaceae bacterium]|nr:hypothetical protein [Selenomonadaceae bacterium]
MAKNITLMLELLKRRPSQRKVKLPYKQSRDSRLKISDDDKVKIQSLMDITNEILGETAFDINISSSNFIRITAFTLGNLKFDINASTKNMMKVVEDSGIRSRRQDLLQLLEAAE